MKLGIKVNADHDSFARLRDTNPKAVEVWFNANEPDKYTDLFAEVKQRHCDVGLHFWGMLDDHIAPNLAYPDESVTKQTLDLMRKTIDIAASNKFQYVNIHPGAAAVSRVNYEKQRYDLCKDPVDTDDSIALFITNARSLHTYAASKGVVLTVETVPVRIPDGWYDPQARLTPKNIHELPARAIIQAAQAKLWVANDFCHTAANVITHDPSAVWSFLLGTTTMLATHTRLIHLGFVIPPYNGSDVHDTLENPIFDTDDAVPNKKQMLELLRLFKNRSDIWILVEPKEDHVKNYFLAQKLLQEAAQN